MILQTRRLKLRPYEPEDGEQFIALNCDPVAREHMNGPLTRTRAAERFEECISSGNAWAVTDLKCGAYIGHSFLSAMSSGDDVELGIVLVPRVWRSGYGTEVVNAVVEYGHSKYARIIATVDAGHIASIKVLRKAGFIFCREASDADGPYCIYESTRHDIGQQNPARRTDSGPRRGVTGV